MKERFRTLLLAALASFVGGVASAQDEEPVRFRPYGFIRNYMAFDTHEVSTGTQDMYSFMPADWDLVDGVDKNAVPSFQLMSLTSRLGLDVSGYRFGEMKVSGLMEGEYCLSGSSSLFRMRHAYIGLLWDNLVLGDLLVHVGHTWHPMSVDMPHLANEETSIPFNPVNRSPQIMAHWTTGHFTWTGGILYPLEYLPTGPDGRSAVYNKYGMIPEVYLGITFAAGGFVGKAGVDFFSILPRWNAPAITEAYVDEEGNKILVYDVFKSRKVNTRLYALTPFVYLQYTKGAFQVKAKSVLAQAGEHMNLLSGYGATFNWKRTQLEYTPMQDWTSFLSFRYGKKWQISAMAGYMMRIGTTKSVFAYNDLTVDGLWLNQDADYRIQRAARVTPTLSLNLGRLTFSLEYDGTAAWFGEGLYNQGGIFGTGHWVLDHRVAQMVRYSF